jgi:anti-sigma factor RsiW
MKHYDNWHWADFVRDLVEPTVRRAMEAHLSTGCARCAKVADTMRAVATTAREDARFAPPEYALRLAHALFAAAKPEKITLRRLVARLVFDSALEPLPAGLRAHDRVSRRALYEAGGYHVDLQLERQPASDVVTLVGQLADHIQPATSTADVPIWLMERESLVESTVCNQFGEFQLEYEPRRNLRLYVPLPEAGKRLEIPLSRLTPGGSRRRQVKKARMAQRRSASL